MTADRVRWSLLLLILATLGSVPLWSSRYVVNVLLLVFVYVAMGSMWNLLAGYSGLVSLGQQMFIGIGGYTLAVLSVYYGVPLSLSVLCGGAVSVLLAVVISRPIFRMKGVYFAIGTWVVAEVLGICFSNWSYVKYGMGMFIQPAYRLSMTAVYYGAMGVGCGAVALVYALLRSNLGLALMAIRDDDVSARSLGVIIFRCKFACFLVAAFVTGVAAGILYLNTIFIQPFEAFGIGWTVKLLFIVIVGGIGTVEGPIVGSALYVFLQQYLAEHADFNLIVMGTVAILVLLIAPRGIVGTVKSRLAIELLPTRRR